MNDSAFNIMIRHIATYLQRIKQPSKDQLKLWHRRVEYIPDTAVTFIRDYICDNCDTFPKNPTKQIKTAYNEWKKSNNYKVKYQDTECNECFGHGYLFGIQYVIENKKRIPYRNIYRCISCENWNKHFGTKIPGANINQIRAWGYDVIDNRKPSKVKHLGPKKIKVREQILKQLEVK